MKFDFETLELLERSKSEIQHMVVAMAQVTEFLNSFAKSNLLLRDLDVLLNNISEDDRHELFIQSETRKRIHQFITESNNAETPSKTGE